MNRHIKTRISCSVLSLVISMMMYTVGGVDFSDAALAELEAKTAVITERWIPASRAFCCNDAEPTSAGCELNDISSTIDGLFACSSTPITQPMTITQPGSYCLANNISQTVGPALVIASDNVVLNLNGFSIILVGSNAANIAVEATGRRSITIKNGVVRGLGASSVRGIKLDSCSQVRLENITFTGVNTGLTLSACTVVGLYGLFMYDCRGTAAYGILINEGTSCVTAHNISMDSIGANGIFVDGSGGTIASIIVREFQTTDMNLDGGTGAVYVTNGQSIVVDEGFQHRLDGSAIQYDSSNGVVVSNCYTSDHAESVRLTATLAARVVRSGALKGDAGGIGFYRIAPTSTAVLRSCTVTSAGGRIGFAVDAATDNTVAIFDSIATINNSDEPVYDIVGSHALVRNCNANSAVLGSFAIGFNNGDATNQFYENVACMDSPGVPFSGVVSAPVESAANARGMDNVSSSQTQLDQVEIALAKTIPIELQLDVITSKVDLLLTVP